MFEATAPFLYPINLYWQPRSQHLFPTLRARPALKLGERSWERGCFIGGLHRK